MGKKSKVSFEEKLSAIQEYQKDNGGKGAIATKYGVDKSPFSQWLINYEAYGPE